MKLQQAELEADKQKKIATKATSDLRVARCLSLKIDKQRQIIRRGFLVAATKDADGRDKEIQALQKALEGKSEQLSTTQKVVHDRDVELDV